MRTVKLLFIVILGGILSSCNDPKTRSQSEPAKSFTDPIPAEPYLVILGTVQDAGSPQIGCEKKCCKDLFRSPVSDRKVVSLGVVDPENKKSYLFEATPDIATQIDILKTKASHKAPWLPDAIFLTHAHIGHYTGLMYLGKEAMNTDRLPVFCMPGMKLFLEENGPWSQLVSAGNISLQEINNKQQLRLTPNIAVEPFLVPHRDEYSETVGYKITGPNISVLFIPDIDKWTSWETDIVAAIYEVDYAFLDATFYDGEEIDNRDISEIPHPFVIESLALFRDLPDEERSKINFIHFNHTNPLLNIESAASRQLLDKGYHIARLRQTLKL